MINRAESRRRLWIEKKMKAQGLKPAIDPVKLGLLNKLMENGTKGIPQSKTVIRMEGVLGERSGNDAWVEEVIKPETGGTFLKLLGNSVLFPGAVPQKSVFSLELVKFLAFELPRKSYLFALYIACLFIFRKRKLYWILHGIDHRTLQHIEIPAKEYCKTANAANYAMSKGLKEVFGIDINKPYYPIYDPSFNQFRWNPRGLDAKTNTLGWIIALCCKFISIFLELDTAYRFRIQDAFALLGGKRYIKEFFRMLEILICRENENGVPYKWKFVRLAARIGFFLQPKIKDFVVCALKYLNVNEIRMTPADWYFALGYNSYRFNNMSNEQRFALREKIDTEKGHIFFFGANR